MPLSNSHFLSLPCPLAELGLRIACAQNLFSISICVLIPYPIIFHGVHIFNINCNNLPLDSLWQEQATKPVSSSAASTQIRDFPAPEYRNFRQVADFKTSGTKHQRFPAGMSLVCARPFTSELYFDDKSR